MGVKLNGQEEDGYGPLPGIRTALEGNLQNPEIWVLFYISTFLLIMGLAVSLSA
ncbi:MAG: hypothetical protein WC861_07210 [Candidatus Micrarchaeia archaeon]